MRRHLIILGIALMVIGNVSAQSSKMKRADKAFENLNYQEAIELYNEILGKEDNDKAKIRLAESYRKVNNSQEAEYWLGQVVNLPESEAVHKLYYGMALQTNGKCDLAKEWFIKYVEEAPDDLRGQYLVRACDYEEELMTKNEGVYEIENMPFNTDLDDFSPMLYGEGIVYASEYKDSGTPIKREHTWTGNPFLELFYVERTKVRKRNKEHGYEYGSAKAFSNRLNSKYHDASVTFNADETQIYFTRNNFIAGKTGRDDDGAIRLKIFSAESQGAGYAWVNLEGMPFNSDEYSVAHPALSPDGEKLYFSSDMPGGFGGMDLYVTELDNGRWGPPSNLGPGINTEGHEVFPYVAYDGHFYFASNGHVGLGGLDIYKMQIRDNGEFGNIENLGYPINTTSDDFGIVMNKKGDFGYFSSDRDGGFGKDDIYSFKKSAAKVRLLVIDEATGRGIPNAEVISELTGNTYMTNAVGIVELDQKINECSNFTASADDYIENAKEGCTKELKDEEGLVVEIPLRKNLVFDLFGIVKDQTTNKPISNAMVELIPSGCNDLKSQTVTTDRDGKYSFGEIGKDCCFEIRASKDPFYLASRSRKQCTNGINESTSFKQDLVLAPVKPVQTVVSNTLVRPSHTTTVTSVPSSTTHTSSGHVSGSTPHISSGTVTSHHSGNTVQHSNSHTVTGTTSSHSGHVTYNNNVTVQPANTLSSFGQGRTPGTYLLHIYYDFDQSYIREDALQELNKLYRMLKENSKYVVEIGSHTDSRGSYKYNDRLSQRRAESVVRWLKEKGISGNRLKSKGYGETVNVNNCKNNVPCSEEEHQWNRRTEFRVLGYYDANGQFISMVESAKPTHVSVDQCQGCPF